ncbi:hypothetical protein GCM10009674_23510 [Nesterenkonia xinjiangensis]|nr:DUF6318 family protein [Nesterenkonia xinjiangensis]
MVSDDARGLSQGWIRPITGLLLVAALALTGCGTGPEAAGTAEPDGGESVEPQETRSQGAYEKPGEQGPEDIPQPEEPAEVHEQTIAAAEEVLRYWMDLYVYARNTGDVVALEDRSHEDCASCDAHIDRISEVFDSGSWFVQEPYEIPYVEFTELDTGAVGGLFMLNETDFDVYWQGEFDGTNEGTLEQIWTGHLDFTDEGWQVLSVRYEMPAAEREDETP